MPLRPTRSDVWRRRMSGAIWTSIRSRRPCLAPGESRYAPGRAASNRPASMSPTHGYAAACIALQTLVHIVTSVSIRACALRLPAFTNLVDVSLMALILQIALQRKQHGRSAQLKSCDQEMILCALLVISQHVDGVISCQRSYC
jgi:hypothetical protein